MNKQLVPHDENVRVTEDGIFLRAPRRPFPWWGPFDATDAIGRFLLFTGLSFLAGLFSIGAVPYVINELRLYDEAGLIFALAVFAAVAILFAAMGLGILLRHRWGIFLAKFWTAFIYAILIILMPKEMAETASQSRMRILILKRMSKIVDPSFVAELIDLL